MAMFDKMRQAKKLYGLQKKAKAIQRELRDTEIEAESMAGQVKVTVSADQKLQDVSIDPEALKPENGTKIEKALKSALNEANKEAQRIATAKMKAISGDLGLPGF